MIKPLPLKLEGQKFEVEQLTDDSSLSQIPLDLNCMARYEDSVERFGDPFTPRGVAYATKGAYLACYIRRSKIDGSLQHRHTLFADPHEMFPWTDPFTNETYDMVKREADQPK